MYFTGKPWQPDDFINPNNCMVSRISSDNTNPEALETIRTSLGRSRGNYEAMINDPYKTNRDSHQQPIDERSNGRYPRNLARRINSHRKPVPSCHNRTRDQSNLSNWEIIFQTPENRRSPSVVWMEQKAPLWVLCWLHLCWPAAGDDRTKGNPLARLL